MKNLKGPNQWRPQACRGLAAAKRAPLYVGPLVQPEALTLICE